MVVDGEGPVAGARVRIQATAKATLTGPDGSFVVSGLVEGSPLTVSAWADGYYCAKAEGIVPPAEAVTLTLRLYQTTDNPQYEWIAPVGEICETW